MPAQWRELRDALLLPFFAGIARSILRKLCRDGALVSYRVLALLVLSALLSRSSRYFLPLSPGAVWPSDKITESNDHPSDDSPPDSADVFTAAITRRAAQRNNNFRLGRFYCESRRLSRIDSRGEVVSRMTAIANFSIVARSHKDRY